MPSWEPPYPTPHWRLRRFFSTPTNWEPPRPVLVHGHTYALTDEVRKNFPSAGLHLIPRETPEDLLVPEFTGYEDPREAEKWITLFCEWTIMNGMSQGLCKELLVEYLKRALRHVPHHPLKKKTYECWEDLLRDFFLDMNIPGLPAFKAWYWLKRKEVPIIWFSHTELKLCTNYFDSSLCVGESDESRLIKGLMPNRNHPVVVKRLKRVVDSSIQKVLNEINVHRYLTKNHHGDVCRLLGFSTCADDPLLVYEYMPNGNLREHMREKYGDYIWQNAPCRLSILIDIASGIAELHYNSKKPVYHRDIEPSNILLDNNYRAKISDFGDAVVIKSEDDRHKHLVCGSLGYTYLCPILRATGRCDDKSDVWSLGVIMLELATSLKAWDPFRQKEYGMNPFLVGLMMERIKKGTAEELLRPGRPYDIGTPYTMEGTAIVVELVRVALWCCCPDLQLRPRANQVADVLLQIQSRWVTPGLSAIQQTTEGGVMPTLQGQKDEIPLGETRPPEKEKPVFFVKLPVGAVKLDPPSVPKDQAPKSQDPQANLDKELKVPPNKDQSKPASPGGKSPEANNQPKSSSPGGKSLAGKDQLAANKDVRIPQKETVEQKSPAGKPPAKK